MNAGASPSKKAKESPHVQRTRKKLERRLKEIDTKITPQALQEVSRNIHSWIRRHEPEREKITGIVRVFDGNANSAPVHSHLVREKLTQLRKEIEQERTGDLRGRVRMAREPE